MLMTNAHYLFLMALFLLPFSVQAEEDICTSADNVFRARVDLFASELGHYMFEECGDVVNPTLGLKVNEVYTFVQVDRSNYYHPLGITHSTNTFKLGNTTLLKDVYERKFFEPLHIWTAYQEFSVQVRFPDTSLAMNPSYYCLIHAGMEGRIKLLPGKSNGYDFLEKEVESNGQQGTVAKAAERSFADMRSDFDKQCGTYGLKDFQLPNPLCPDRFICGKDGISDELKRFSSCLEAANCAMMSGMTTGVKATADSALFIHQMIPHHQNAVNTAKTLLKMGNLLCPDLTDEMNPDCVLEGILREIVAGQNHQIQLMRRFLSDHRYPQTDNCDVFVETVDKADMNHMDLTNGAEVVSMVNSGAGPSQLFAMGWALLTVLLGLIVL